MDLGFRMWVCTFWYFVSPASHMAMEVAWSSR